jgi:tRNA threonylcarbamoyladenosine biosynthesis protein TsaB
VKVLALDTATENCSAALLIDSALIAREQLLARGHAEHILTMIDALLQEAGVRLGQLSAIAFGRGPGAFTGVRLAASITQGLAYGAGIPVVPISDLRALAQRVMDLDPGASRVLVCADARMREVYWGCFERQVLAAGVVAERVGPPASVALPGAWSGALDVHAAGSGFAAYSDLGNRLGEPLARIHEGLLPRAAEIARLAAPEVTAARALSPEEALPVYLREEVTSPRPEAPARHSH